MPEYKLYSLCFSRQPYHVIYYQLCLSHNTIRKITRYSISALKTTETLLTLTDYSLVLSEQIIFYGGTHKLEVFMFHKT